MRVIGAGAECEVIAAGCSFSSALFSVPAVFRLGAFLPFKAALSVSLFPLLYFSSLFFTSAVFSFCFSPPPWGSIFSFLFPLFSSFFLLASFLNSSSICGEGKEDVAEQPLRRGGT